MLPRYKLQILKNFRKIILIGWSPFTIDKLSTGVENTFADFIDGEIVFCIEEISQYNLTLENFGFRLIIC